MLPQSARLADLAVEKGASIFLTTIADDSWTELNFEFTVPVERQARAGAGGTSNPDALDRTARGERPSVAVAPFTRRRRQRFLNAYANALDTADIDPLSFCPRRRVGAREGSRLD